MFAPFTLSLSKGERSVSQRPAHEKRARNPSCIPIIVCLFLLNPLAGAQEPIPLDPVVVTASRIEEPVGETGGSVTVIPREEIEARGAVTVEEALRGVEGVTLQSFQGRYDLFTVLTLRGSESEQTLFLIDGMEVNSPFDQRVAIGPLNVNDVDRIEIVRGPQSALYGSQAMGGVIQVFTREGDRRPGWSFFSEGGSLQTFREGMAYSHSGTPSYRFDYTRFYTGGAAGNTAINGDQAGATLRWDRGQGSLRASFRYRRTEKGYNVICCALFEPLDPAVPIIRFYLDPNSEAVQRWALYQVSYTGRPSERTDYRLDLARVDERIEDRNPAESGVAGYYPLAWEIRTEGVRDRIEFQQNFYLDAGSTLTLLAEFKREEAAKGERSNIGSLGLEPVEALDPVERTRRNGAVAVQYRLDPRPEDRIAIGYRLDRHSRFGNAVSPRMSWSHRFPISGTRVYAAYGEGFRAPSLEENFNPLRGNPDLRPEKNRSHEAGIRQPFPWRGLNLGWTYHRADYRDLIDVNPEDPLSPILVNVSQARIQGNEWTLSMTPFRTLSLEVHYSTLQTEDRDHDQPLPFRPRRSVDGNLRYLGERWTFNGEIHRVGTGFMPFSFLKDIEGRPFGETMPAYTRVNVAASRRLLREKSDMKLYARVDNLLDERIEEISGFPLPGRTFLAGVQAEF